MPTYSLLLSGGTGTRLGADIPKQYIEVAGRMIAMYSLETMSKSPEIDGIFVVADDAWHEVLTDAMSESDYFDIKKFIGFAAPGENRQLSLYNGMKTIQKHLLSVSEKAEEDEKTYVFIHDAARPMLSEEMIRSCTKAANGHDGAMPVLPMKDTVYLSEGNKIVSLLDRKAVVAGQAPEIFEFDKYLAANERLIRDGSIMKINGSTEPAVMAGMDIAIFPGDEKNIKITTPEDLERFISIGGHKNEF